MILCIDLKSYYASVECALRGLDPFKTNLVVADVSRGNGSIVLAATPCIKAHGAKSRCRIFELPKNVKPIYAKPRMNKYIEYSAKIYEIYLRYVSKDDIHVYSIDEAFLDLTPYMKYYNKSIFEIAKEIIKTVFDETKITATCGIGENMFLSKVALDILAKHEKDNIGFLNKKLLEEKIWSHRPITDIWGIGQNIAKRLERMRIYTLGDINKIGLNRMKEIFGVIGQEIYDHSRGIDESKVSEIKDYVPSSKSIGNGQVLFEDYNYKDAFIVLEEMVYKMVLDLVGRKMVLSTVSLTVVYSKEYQEGFLRQEKMDFKTDNFSLIMAAFKHLYYGNVINLPIRNIMVRGSGLEVKRVENFDLFTDEEKLIKENNLFKTIAEIRQRYGKNAVNKAISLHEKATLIKRNETVGGHNAN